MDRLVAKLRLIDSSPESIRPGGDAAGFWDAANFPRHTRASLLPDERIRFELLSAMNYVVEDTAVGIGG
jgi:hypothetical protein